MAPSNGLFDRLKHDAEGFSPRQKTLAKFILANYQKVAFATIKELARLSATSEATIVRFVKALGFSGYPTFLKEIRRIVRKNLKGQERFRLIPQGQRKGETLLTRFLDKELENLSSLNEAFDEKTFREAVAAFRSAKEVMVVGARSTASLAYHLWFGLTKVGIRSRRVTSVTSESYDEVNTMGRDSLVVIIGFPRYLRELVELLEFAKARKVRTITITDSPFSPLLGDRSLLCPAESVSFMAFHGAPMVLINAILDALGFADQQGTVSALDRFEKLAEHKGYFASPDYPRTSRG